MNIKTLVISLILSAIIIVSAIMIFNNLSNNKTDNSGNFENPDKTKTIYTLKSYNNNAALYLNGEQIKIYDTINIDVLPRADRELLESGISRGSFEEIAEVIQDYDG